MGDVCKLMLSDDQHRLAVERMKRIRDRRLERQNPGIIELRSDQGAENWAAIASLVETCKLYGVDPQAYFADVLTKLVNLWPASRLDELMPWGWAAQRSADRLAA